MTSPAAPLRRRTIVALLWSGFGSYGASGLHLLSILALGYLLPPSDFGLLALALIFLGFAEGIGELGMTAALIQQPEIDRRALDSAFWCNLAVCLLLAAVTFLAAEPITALLGDPGAAALLRLLSLVFLISALSVVPRAILIKELSFRGVSTAQLFGEIGFGVVGLGLAALGFGAWSLGGAVLAQRALIAVMLWRAVDYRPGLSLDRAALGRLVRFGGPVTAATLVERAVARADYFVIGRFVGTEALGYYSLALQLALVPLERLVGLTHRVAFPAFSIVQEDVRRLKDGLLEGLRHLAAAVVPVVLAIVVLGPWLLEAIYGEKWEPSIVPLRILGLAGLCLMSRLMEAALLAVGRARLRLALSVLRLTAFALLVATVGVDLGVGGVAGAVAGALAVWAGAYLLIGMRALGIGPAEIAASLWPAVRAGVAALTPLLLFLVYPAARLSPWAALAYGGTTMAVIYLALVLPAYRESISARFRS